jgi:hypothetical protein
MVLRAVLTFVISRMVQFPSEFELSGACRIFNQSALSQKSCGACSAFAVSTAYAMRECAREGRDVIPSPHMLFDCGGGGCAEGASLGQMVDALNSRGTVRDADDAVAEFGWGCAQQETSVDIPYPISLFEAWKDDEANLKTELFVFKNPLLVTVEPDLNMILYPYSTWKGRKAQGNVEWFQTVDNKWIPAVKPPEGQELPIHHTKTPLYDTHVMVVLGWGSHPEPHWIVQNSWGRTWGRDGKGKIGSDDIKSAVVLDSSTLHDKWILLIWWLALSGAMLATEGVLNICKWMRRREKDKDSIV